ncbi:MAG: holo-ACP synthase [Deltaproteobacteria bacterium]|nr:holo-ACP synthase [Deltaproteobacteria bacterium]
MTIIGVGVDLVNISELRTRIERNPSILKHVFTLAEVEWCQAYFDPAERYSGRFAAKEAFYKALPPWVQNETDWLDIEIIAGSNGRPEVQPSKKCKTLLQQVGASKIFLSIAHQSGLAIAFIVLCGEEGGHL